MDAGLDFERCLLQVLRIFVVCPAVRFARDAAQRSDDRSLRIEDLDLQVALRLLLQKIGDRSASRRVRKAGRAGAIRVSPPSPPNGIKDREQVQAGSSAVLRA